MGMDLSFFKEYKENKETTELFCIRKTLELFNLLPDWFEDCVYIFPKFKGGIIEDKYINQEWWEEIKIDIKTILDNKKELLNKAEDKLEEIYVFNTLMFINLLYNFEYIMCQEIDFDNYNYYFKT